MYELKPGAGFSSLGMFGGIIGAVFGTVFIVIAAMLSAPTLVVALGAVFVVVSIAAAIYSYSSATSSNPPLGGEIIGGHPGMSPVERGSHGERKHGETAGGDGGGGGIPLEEHILYCSQCGQPIHASDKTCAHCGKLLQF